MAWGLTLLLVGFISFCGGMLSESSVTRGAREDKRALEEEIIRLGVGFRETDERGRLIFRLKTKIDCQAEAAAQGNS